MVSPGELCTYKLGMSQLSYRCLRLIGALLLPLACTPQEPAPSAPGELDSKQASSSPGEQTAAALPLCSRWIAAEQADQIVAEGGVLLDVRSTEEYQTEHIDGARNIPVDELENRLSELAGESHIVVYCKSGRRAHRAAEILQSGGMQVSELGHLDRYKSQADAGCR